MYIEQRCSYEEIIVLGGVCYGGSTVYRLIGHFFFSNVHTWKCMMDFPLNTTKEVIPKSILVISQVCWVKACAQGIVKQQQMYSLLSAVEHQCNFTSIMEKELLSNIDAIS